MFEQLPQVNYQYGLEDLSKNLAVFDDVSVELAMALLQLLGQAPARRNCSAPSPRWRVWRTTRRKWRSWWRWWGRPPPPSGTNHVAALARLAHHSQEVAQLVALVGPPPAAFRYKPRLLTFGYTPLGIVHKRNESALRREDRPYHAEGQYRGCPVSGECAFGLRQAGGMKEQLISFDPAWDRAPTLARRGSSSRRTHVDAQ
ncbi:hypothetical protein MSG28_010780 [Choristoneura fumiferana]|uniref:Uncharacterized protein n=1 Tax=Choristoneura fumiferana TaxID=7141 RepID=A0ACC0KNQ6_CHOFU|nr:hypothetical protein MSG28_010780 [Choristoneura fumiferana]